MNNTLMLVVSVLAGTLLSCVYFGGLWLTIQKLLGTGRPAWLLMGSFLLRLVIVMVGFYLVWDGHLERLALSLVAFFVTRFFFIQHFQPNPERSIKINGNQP